jgi:hypothetical protein
MSIFTLKWMQAKHLPCKDFVLYTLRICLKAIGSSSAVMHSGIEPEQVVLNCSSQVAESFFEQRCGMLCHEATNPQQVSNLVHLEVADVVGGLPDWSALSVWILHLFPLSLNACMHMS